MLADIFSIIAYSTYICIFIVIILLVRHIYYTKVYGISPKELSRRLREKGVSRLRLAIAPLTGRYYILAEKVGLRYEILKILVLAIFMAYYIGIVVPLIGFVAGKQLMLIWIIPQIFLYTFLIFFLIGIPFALYHYYLIKSGRTGET